MATQRINGNGVRAAAENLRERFEERLDDVKSRFTTFQKDWSKTVGGLVTRGRSAEKDLRKRLDKVSKDLNKNPYVLKLRKNPAWKKVTDRVTHFDYDKAVKDLRREVKVIQGDVVEFFQSSAQRVKKVIDLPSRGDFDRLHKKIESLSAQVRSLEKRKRA